MRARKPHAQHNSTHQSAFCWTMDRTDRPRGIDVELSHFSTATLQLEQLQRSKHQSHGISPRPTPLQKLQRDNHRAGLHGCSSTRSIADTDGNRKLLGDGHGAKDLDKVSTDARNGHRHREKTWIQGCKTVPKRSVRHRIIFKGLTWCRSWH